MKKFTLFSLLVLGLFNTTKATVYTVSNNTVLPGSPGQYTTVSAAISAAANGDTIYIQPSATSYGNFTVTKGLTIIGAGYNPQTTSGLKSETGNITFGNGSSNSKLLGLYLNGEVNFSNTFLVSNFTVQRCFIMYRFNFSNGANSPTGRIQVENCYVYGGNGHSVLSPSTSCTIRNNFFDSGGQGVINGQNSTQTDTIRNNIFICGSTGIVAMKNDLIENNIFYSNFPDASNVTNSFNNNYVFGASTLPYGTNVGSGNITNTVPPFNVFVCGQNVLYTTDFRPASGHATINAGTDGTNIGFTGGLSPFYKYPAPYPMTGEPAIPQVREVTVPVSSVPAGGTLNINVKARKRN
jgi:hypothetical protein